MPVSEPVPHLWEVNHAYYCNEGNYFNPDCHVKYETIIEFIAAEGRQDMDYNLVFRWDWIENDYNDEPTYTGDDYYRNGRLLIFFMGQRKGIYRSAEVSVCRADEELVIAYLKPRFEYLKNLWSPLL